MTTIQDIDRLTGYTPPQIVARLVIKPRRGKVLVHDLTEAEAIELRDRLDDALGETLMTPHTPAVCPSWGELAGTGEPCFFSQEIRDEFDARHPVGVRT
jgi:hypothetical protein